MQHPTTILYVKLNCKGRWIGKKYFVREHNQGIFSMVDILHTQKDKFVILYDQ